MHLCWLLWSWLLFAVGRLVYDIEFLAVHIIWLLIICFSYFFYLIFFRLIFLPSHSYFLYSLYFLILSFIYFSPHSPTIHGSIRLEKINNSKIYLGPCCTSVYVEECSNITIYLACHQLRIHRSHNCFFYVKVNSHPIIEDCTGFGFAPYSLSYDGIQDDYKVRTCSTNIIINCEWWMKG